MPLESGFRLGPYEIIRPIGAGGMGEVYEARDGRLERIVAIKDAANDIVLTSLARMAMDESTAIYSGNDNFTLASMAVGAVGVVSVASPLVGREIASMVEAASKGDFEEARRWHEKLMPTFEACFIEPNPVPVKAALSELWEDMAAPRLPLLPAHAETTRTLVDAVNAVRS